jgi:hypothetical protein
MNVLMTSAVALLVLGFWITAAISFMKALGAAGKGTSFRMIWQAAWGNSEVEAELDADCRRHLHRMKAAFTGFFCTLGMVAVYGIFQASRGG